MTVNVSVISGPDNGAFLYLHGTEGVISTVRSVSLAALADGSVTVAGERAALVAEVERMVTNWNAAQAAIADL